MKFVLILALATVALARPDDHYDSKYDDFNIDEVIGNKRLMKAYANCFIEGVKCTAEGAEFKKWLPEASQTSCAKCTEKQKKLAAKIIVVMQKDMAEDWVRLHDKIDPEGKYTDNLKKFLEKYGP